MAPSRISVVIPACRAESQVTTAIRSVLEQDDIDVEVIVVVDGRFDATAEVSAAIPGVRVLVNDRREGAQATRNSGLAAATADYVTFLDADDYVEGPLHRGMVDALGRDRADIVFASWVKEDATDGARGATVQAADLKEEIGSNTDLICRWVTGQNFVSGAVAWRTERLRRIGGWNAGLARLQDFEVGLRSLALGLRATYADAGQLIYVQHRSPHRISSNPTAMLPSRSLMALLVAQYAESPNDRLHRAIGSFAYWMARGHFSHRHVEEARLMLAAARRYGMTGHAGSLLHRLACAILGIELKERLAYGVHSAADVLGRAGPPVWRGIQAESAAALSPRAKIEDRAPRNR